MEQKESKVLGIPFVLIGFVILNAIVVLVPVVFMQYAVIKEVRNDVAPKVVKQVVVVTPTVSPTPTVTSTVLKTTVKPTVQSVKVATPAGVRK